MANQTVSLSMQCNMFLLIGSPHWSAHLAHDIHSLLLRCGVVRARLCSEFKLLLHIQESIQQPRHHTAVHQTGTQAMVHVPHPEASISSDTNHYQIVIQYRQALILLPHNQESIPQPRHHTVDCKQGPARLPCTACLTQSLSSRVGQNRIYIRCKYGIVFKEVIKYMVKYIARSTVTHCHTAL